ncbi:MAG TPA: ATP-binding cassette domain-containing protein [Aggregatilineaceae bacterium]|nr:ATP-binding cassette domain-containing protein [Aggregatilineaceae bacterium]
MSEEITPVASTENLAKENGKNGSSPLIFMSNITRRFGLIAALEDVNFAIYPQEIIGLLGDNGAGKSTLIKVLTGVHEPSEGQIYFEGKPVSIPNSKVAQKLGIATVYQDLALVNLMSISRNFCLGREPTRKIGPFNFLDKERMNAETVGALADIGIQIRRPSEEVLRMSGGERQSIAIGRAAHFGQKLLILDEPTSALSVGETRKVLNYTHEAKRKGMSVIFITHNIGHVYQVADRFTIISHGHKVGDFLKGEVSQEEISEMIMGGPIPERLVSVVEAREAELSRLRDQMLGRTETSISARTRKRQRIMIAIAAVVLLIAAGIGALVLGGAFDKIETKEVVVTCPQVDIATAPEKVQERIAILKNADEVATTRATAAAFLSAEKNQHLASVQPLVDALSDPAWEVKQGAAKALGKFKKEDVECAIAPLQDLLHDPQSPVRDAASQTLLDVFNLSCSDSDVCSPNQQ